MDIRQISELTIDGKSVSQLYMNGKLAWKKFVDPGMTILKFNGGSGLKTLNIASIKKITDVESIMIDTGAD